MFNRSDTAALVNAVVQSTAMFASMSGIVWAMYPIMTMIAFIAFMQSVAAAGLISGLVKDKYEDKDTGYGVRVLIGILYLMSSYQVYIIGFEVFSGVMFAHATIFLLTNLFGVIKKK